MKTPIWKKKTRTKITVSILSLIAATAALWWGIFALKPYQISPEQMQARYRYSAPAAFTPTLKDLGRHGYEVRFNSFDGAAVNGRLQYPSDPAQAKAPFPLLIAMHGLGRSHMRWWQATYKGGETLEHTHLVTEQALKRTQRYCEHLERLISPEGCYPTIGRSLTYRTAAFQPLALLALQKKLPASLPEGQVRAALHAVHQSIWRHPSNFTSDGFLTLGFAGHNPQLALFSLGLNPLGMAGGHIKNNFSHIRMTACSA